MQALQQIITQVLAVVSSLFLSISQTAMPTPALVAPEQPVVSISADRALTQSSPVTATLKSNINLRTGPSLIHHTIKTYVMDDLVTVRGKAIGAEWLLVITADQKTGWMSAEYLETQGSLSQIPVIDLSNDTYTISGTVIDPDGKPYKEVNIAIYRDSDTRTDSYTNSEGKFYSYVPMTPQNNTWIVGIVGLPCEITEKNVDCTRAKNSQYPPPAEIIVPQEEPITFYVGRTN